MGSRSTGCIRCVRFKSDRGRYGDFGTDLSLTITTKTDWTYTDIMTSITDTNTGDVQRILSNLTALANAVTLPDDAPAIPRTSS